VKAGATLIGAGDAFWHASAERQTVEGGRNTFGWDYGFSQLSRRRQNYQMRCKTCEGILLRQFIASTRLHRETSELIRLAGRSDRALFTAVLRRCQTIREECREAEAALRAHRCDESCTKALPVDVLWTEREAQA
jgi:hypothetical protein